MPKLAKNMYIANGERRLNCYNIAIPKDVVKKAEIYDDDELRVIADGGKIIIEKKYYYICEECGYEWPSGERYTIQSRCPRCHCGDLREMNYDYQQ